MWQFIPLACISNYSRYQAYPHFMKRDITLFFQIGELYLRRNAMRLLTLLLRNHLKETQGAILNCPKSISKLVAILSDLREVLRNDVS